MQITRANIPLMDTDVVNLEEINFVIKPIINAANGRYYLDYMGKTLQKRVEISTGTRLIASPATVTSAIFARTIIIIENFRDRGRRNSFSFVFVFCVDV